MSTLFEPLSVGAWRLPNRLIMAPMTRSRAAAGGLATGLTAAYYAQRASAGLIITEGTQPSAIGQGYIDTPGLHSAAQAASWRPVTEAVHAAGGRIVAQLMHTGRIGHPSVNPDGELPVAPSPIAAPGQLHTAAGMVDFPVPRQLTQAQIQVTVEDFAAAARHAVEAGFDGVELHGANDYLIHQFLAGGSNRRTDGYGGPVAGRIRFAVETVTAVADAIGPQRVGLRLSPGDPRSGVGETDTAELYDALLHALAPAGIAYLHLLETGDRALTEVLRKAWPGVIVLNPHTHPGPATAQDGQSALEDGVADAISLGSLFLANPDLPRRIRAGGPYNQPDPATFYGGDHRGYTDYPALAA
jgi:N-ethylmaleimide reductase